MKRIYNGYLNNERRVFMTVIGVMISGLVIGLFNYAAYGMDPFQVFAHGVWSLLPFGYGTWYTLLNIVMLVAIFKIDKSKIGLGTIINVLLLGYIAEFSCWFFEAVLPEPTLVNRSIVLFLALVILCFGASLYFTANMGVSTYDAVALIMAERKIAKFQYCRVGTDLICTLIGFSFGVTVGIGTLFTALFMGPIIAFFNVKVSQPYLKQSHRMFVARMPRKVSA